MTLKPLALKLCSSLPMPRWIGGGGGGGGGGDDDGGSPAAAAAAAVGRDLERAVAEADKEKKGGYLLAGRGPPIIGPWPSGGLGGNRRVAGRDDEKLVGEDIRDLGREWSEVVVVVGAEKRFTESEADEGSLGESRIGLESEKDGAVPQKPALVHVAQLEGSS
ncbi:hypothetical protein VTK26DRAFT_4179 [Humicola hyalothermophila]